MNYVLIDEDFKNYLESVASRLSSGNKMDADERRNIGQAIQYRLECSDELTEEEVDMI